MAEWIQIGETGLLAYIIFWATQSGVPSLVGALNGIRDALTKNTARIQELRRSSEEILSLVRHSKAK